MADMSSGPDAQRTNRAGNAEVIEGTTADLSTLRVAPDNMTGAALSPPRHTAESVMKRWGAIQVDGGTQMTGRLKGGAA